MGKLYFIFIVCILATLAECDAQRKALGIDPIADKDLNTLEEASGWIEYGTRLHTTRAHGAVLFMDSHVYIVGGCADAACRAKVNVVDQVDPIKQSVVGHFALPVMLKGTVPLTLAGPTAVVRVLAPRNPFVPVFITTDEDQMMNAVFVVGPCSYYHPDYMTNSSKKFAEEQYGTIWHLDSDLKGVLKAFSIPHLLGNGIPYRANASCVSSGSLIFIIGGVDRVTGEVLDTIDVYDTRMGAYTTGVLKLPQALQNTLVASDSAFMYVMGGFRRVVVRKQSAATDEEVCSLARSCASSKECNEAYDLLDPLSLHHNINSSDLSVMSRDVWCMSEISMALLLEDLLGAIMPQSVHSGPVSSSTNFSRRNSQRDERSKIDLWKVTLPCNPELYRPAPRSAFVSSSSAPSLHLFTVRGHLCLMLNTSFVNCLSMEELLMDNISQDINTLSNWAQLSSSVMPLSSSSSMFFALVVPAGILGNAVILFAFGGFSNNLRESGTDRVFYRFSGLSVPGASDIASHVVANMTLNVTLYTPIKGYARLSSSPNCEIKLTGTTDVNIVTQGESFSVASFCPTQVRSSVFVCFAYKRVCVENAFRTIPVAFYTPITAFAPFSIDEGYDPNGKPQKLPMKKLVLLATLTSIACIALTVAVAVLYKRTRKRYAQQGGNYLLDAESPMLKKSDDEEYDRLSIWNAKLSKGKAQPNKNASTDIHVDSHQPLFQPTLMNPKSEKDCLVKNTTNSSRYEVLRRIGEGAFSAVYLVRRKVDGHLFALKYLNCADNKERLDAIRECETINSVQGHPSIIRLVDMFMNYEFEGIEEIPPSLQVPTRPQTTFTTRTTAANGPRWAVIKIKNHRKKENTIESPVHMDAPQLPRLFAVSVASAQQKKSNFTITYQSPGQPPLLSEADVQLLTSVSVPVQNRCSSLWNEDNGEEVKKGSLHTRSGIPSNEEELKHLPQSGALKVEARLHHAKPEVAAGHLCDFPQPHALPVETNFVEQHQQESGLNAPGKATPCVELYEPPIQSTKNAVSAGGVHFTPPPVLAEVHEMTIATANGESARVNNTPYGKLASPMQTPKAKPNSMTGAMCAVQRGNPQLVNNKTREPQRNRPEIQIPTQTPPVKCAEETVPRVSEHLLMSPGRQQIAALQCYGANGGAASASASRLTPKHMYTRYLCLVMEYHPMGDLCHYVLRHSARHNAEIRRQVEAERAAREGRHWRQQHMSREEKGLLTSMEAHTVALDSAEGTTLSFFRLSKGGGELTSNKDTGNEATNRHIHCGSGCGSRSSDCTNGTHTMMSNDNHTNANHSVDWCNPAEKKKNKKNKKEEEEEEEDTKRVFAMCGNALTEPQLLSIAYQLASVLRHLHSQRPPIVHRDLKPENILIRGDPRHADAKEVARRDKSVTRGSSGGGRTTRGKKKRKGEEEEEKNNNNNEREEKKTTKDESSPHISPLLSSPRAASKVLEDVIPIVVTDFGLAVLQEGRWRTGRGGGTRPYIAPESWIGQTSTASDVWSLGCVLYALATARLTIPTVRIMYEEAKREGFAKMILNDILEENYSAALAHFIVSLLVVNPAKRPSAETIVQCFLVENCVVRLNPEMPIVQ